MSNPQVVAIPGHRLIWELNPSPACCIRHPAGPLLTLFFATVKEILFIGPRSATGAIKMKLFPLPNKSPSERQSQLPLPQICVPSDQPVPSPWASAPFFNYFPLDPSTVENASLQMSSNLCCGIPERELGLPFERVSTFGGSQIGRLARLVPPSGACPFGWLLSIPGY